MLHSLIFIAAFLVAAQCKMSGYSAKNLASQIQNLPGLPSNSNLTMFSGYIKVDSTNNRNLFYWFVESKNKPETDPVVLWTNGGPGCSGLLGFFTENGPFSANADGSLTLNPYSWVNIANMLFIEAPAGVGFSYSDVTSDYTTDDNKTAIDNYNFIRGWLQEFTAYENHNFYISSESYGGHYMPTLAQQIIIGNDAGNTPKINFKGVFVGNPYTDPVENAIGTFDTWFGHQLISRPLWLSWYSTCNNGKVNSTDCNKIETQLSDQVGNVDPYALDFPVCLSSNIYTSQKYHFLKKVVYNTLKRPLPKYWMKKIQEEEDYKQSKISNIIEASSDNDNYQACSENYATTYLNRADVQTAIYAKKTTWAGCSNTVNYSADSMAEPMEPTWKWLVAKGNGLHMTIVSGDDDSVCGLLGTQYWLWNMGFVAESNYNWITWTDINDQVGGYMTKFQTTDKKSAINLITVHSAGHMIPQTQPERSLETFKSFLQNKI